MVHPILEHGATREPPIRELAAVEARGSPCEQNVAACATTRADSDQEGGEQARERGRRRRLIGHRTADLFATLTLPFFVLGLVLNQLTRSISGRRRRDRPYIGGRYDAFSSDKDWGTYGKASAHPWDLHRHRSDREP